MTQRWSLRTRFVLFALACLVPLLVVVAFFLDRGIDRNSAELEAGQTTLANLVNQSLTNYLNANYRSMEVVASVPEIVKQDDPERMNAILGEARTFRPELSGIFLVNSSGKVLGESGIDTDLIMTPLRPLIDTTMATGERGISRRIDIDANTSVIVLTVPVTTVTQTETSATTPVKTPVPNDDPTQGLPAPTPTPPVTAGTKPPGTNLGVIGAVIQVDSLNQWVIPTARARTEIAIVSEDQVIASSGDIRRRESDYMQRIADENARARDGETGSFTTRDASGLARAGIFMPVQVDATDWAIIITNPRPGAYVKTLLAQGGIVLAVAGLMIIAFAIVLGEVTARPLRRLASNAVALEKGDFSVPIEPTGSGEILTLSTAMSEMAHQLSTQVSGLQESQRERQLQTEQMRDLLRRTMRMQEDERRRIASEIHDAVSPLITGALYQARALQMTNGATPHEDLAQSLASVNTLLERASTELHGVIFDLRPPDLDDIGVVAAIEAYVSTIQRTGLECRLEVVNDLPPLTPEVRLGIYRIVQEALHNVLRHASADEAVVRLESTDELLRVTVRDNGVGFDPAKARRPTSLGLLSMQERAAAIGATFAIVSRPGGGTAIVIERPNTGSIMSDAVLADMMKPRDASEEPGEVAASEDSVDNGVSDDTSGSPRADAGSRGTQDSLT